jgi:hypothetical protein
MGAKIKDMFNGKIKRRICGLPNLQINNLEGVK